MADVNGDGINDRNCFDSVFGSHFLYYANGTNGYYPYIEDD